MLLVDTAAIVAEIAQDRSAGKLEVKGGSFEFTYEGNTLYGYTKNEKLYVEVSAIFNGAYYSKGGGSDTYIGWKRDKRGGLSKSFCEWVEEASKKLYNAFYGVSR
jgi:hypothetical protein